MWSCEVVTGSPAFRTLILDVNIVNAANASGTNRVSFVRDGA